MNHSQIAMWISRGVFGAAVGVACYWSDLWKFNPWQPNWRLYGVFAVVGFLSGTSGHIRGYIQGRESVEIGE